MSLGAFDDSLTQALDEGIVQDSPEDNLEQSRVPVLRRWLHWLGYLGSDNGKARTDDELIKGLKRFATEANIVLLNSEDPAALISLLWEPVRDHVSFERDDSPNFITSSYSALNDAARRAVTLRLFAFDLFPEVPGKKLKLKRIGKAWMQFRKAAYSLLLLEDITDEDAALKLLFNQETILQQLGSTTDVFKLRKPSEWSKNEKLEIVDLAKRFIAGAAGVELWLRGYDTGIVTRQTKKTDGGNRPTIPVAMRHFWKDQSKEDIRPADEWETLDGLFFQTLIKLDQPVLEQTSTQEVASLLDEVLKKPENVRELKKSYRSVLTVIWDGFKRAASWLFNLFKRTANALMQGIRNLARWIKKGAMQVASVVGYIMKGIKMSMTYLFRKTLPGSDPDTVVIQHDFDFDLNVYVSANAPPELISKFIKYYSLMVDLFEVSFEFLSKLFSLFRKVIRGVTTALGWLGIVLALRKLKDLFSVSKELVQRTKELIGLYEEVRILKVK